MTDGYVTGAPGGRPRRSAIITGGGTGIGAATARVLAADGTGVVLAARRPEPIAAIAAELGECAVAVTADAASAADMARAVAAARDRFGPVSTSSRTRAARAAAPPPTSPTPPGRRACRPT